MHTTSKERMAPEVMFLIKRMSQLSITDSKVKWPLRFVFSYVRPVTALQIKNSRRNASAINPVTMENTDDSHLHTGKPLNYCKSTHC